MSTVVTPPAVTSFFVAAAIVLGLPSIPAEAVSQRGAQGQAQAATNQRFGTMDQNGDDVYGSDTVQVQTSGSVQMSSDTGDVADPGGSRTNRLSAEAPMARQLAGALIGRVEQGAPFLIGARVTPIRMPQTGRLFLSVNDDHLDDNRGEFLAAVSVQRASR
jgi:hypothetical protein